MFTMFKSEMLPFCPHRSPHSGCVQGRIRHTPTCAFEAECLRDKMLFCFYLSDICLKEVTSMADSLYNIRLLREFSNEYLNRCFYLTLEDMLYAPLVLKVTVSY